MSEENKPVLPDFLGEYVPEEKKEEIAKSLETLVNVAAKPLEERISYLETDKYTIVKEKKDSVSKLRRKRR
jgi:hypothetical protein